jgi:hypothetical protein
MQKGFCWCGLGCELEWILFVCSLEIIFWWNDSRRTLKDRTGFSWILFYWIKGPSKPLWNQGPVKTAGEFGEERTLPFDTDTRVQSKPEPPSLRLYPQTNQHTLGVPSVWTKQRLGLGVFRSKLNALFDTLPVHNKGRRVLKKVLDHHHSLSLARSFSLSLTHSLVLTHFTHAHSNFFEFSFLCSAEFGIFNINNSCIELIQF